ncbi:MAG: nucleotide exchange factor GrpE [Mariprofundales bacterium]|nr:nucleotide exchange factor GrpE [Mariprofundales bacterium]
MNSYRNFTPSQQQYDRGNNTEKSEVTSTKDTSTSNTEPPEPNATEPDTAEPNRTDSPVEEISATAWPQEAQEEIDTLQDKLLRAHAEMENLRKRSAREIADARKFAVERFATSLLDVVDNLERALDVEAGQEQALRDGIQLTLDSWKTLMNRFELERFDAIGELFDAHRHEALSKVPSEEPVDTIIAQHVAGYTLHGRLIRAAKVLLSSGNG